MPWDTRSKRNRTNPPARNTASYSGTVQHARQRYVVHIGGAARELAPNFLPEYRRAYHPVIHVLLYTPSRVLIVTQVTTSAPVFRPGKIPSRYTVWPRSTVATTWPCRVRPR